MFCNTYFGGKRLTSWLATAAIIQVGNTISTLKIDTSVGTVYGLLNGSHPDVAQFLGIPFAEPPVGDRRWTAPVVKSPVGEIDATKFGPSCPQYDTSIPSTYEVDAREFLISGPTSEDCLTLSIWAPFAPRYSKEDNHEPLPVLVWLYGGGHNTGGGQIEYQIPTPWVQRTQAHIVVQVNYRVNVFGYPSAAGLDTDSINFGLLDQRLAIEWVRANIANFGGDPSKITIWGQSAGASSVDFYNFAYPNDPIVSGIIMDSSNALSSPPAVNDTHKSFTYLSQQFGCGNLSATEELACMRKVSSVGIETFLKSHGDSRAGPVLTFGPLVDGVTVFENYTARALAGNFTKVPAIHGTNNNEGSSLSVWVNNGTTVNVTLANANTVSRACAAALTTRNRYAVGATTFRYYYTGNFSNIAPRTWEGAYHSSELPLIFGTHDIARGPSTDFEIALSHRMQDLWLAFMRDPQGGLPAQGWPAYTPDGNAMEFGWDGQLTSFVSVAEFDKNCDLTTYAPLPGSVPPDSNNFGLV